MANIGDQLTNPESGMKRIDNTFYAIKFSGNGWTSFNNGDINYNNGTGHSNNKKGEYYEIYCYTSKFNIIANYTIEAEKFISMGKSTPFNKHKVETECVGTLIKGEFVYRTF